MIKLRTSKSLSFKRKIRSLIKNEITPLEYCFVIASPSNIRWLLGYETKSVIITEESTSNIVVRIIATEYQIERVREVIDLSGEIEIEIVKDERIAPKGIPFNILRNICDKKHYFFDLGYLGHEIATYVIEKFNARDISKIIRELRRRKDEYEIAMLKENLKIAESALKKLQDVMNNNITELKTAGFLELFMREEGAEDFAFPSIVAFGENSAYPMHIPTGENLDPSKPALIDIGAVREGMRSDITRTCVPDKQPFLDWLVAITESIKEGLKVVRSGVKAKEVDAAIRRTIREYGIEDAFVYKHVSGHGIGADVHESPYLAPDSNHILIEGDVITIEPGIYVKGQGGIRIEQTVVVERMGNKVLNELPIIYSC